MKNQIRDTKKSAIFNKEDYESEIYKNSFESSPYFNILIDLDGNIININKKLADFLDIPKEEIIGKHFTEFTEIFVEGEDPGKYKEMLSLFIGGIEIGSVETKINTKKGVRWIEASPTSLKKDGKIFAVEIFAQDITDKKITENKLKFQANILQNINESVIVTDLLGQIIYWNKVAESIFGYGKNEVLEKSLAIIFPETSEDSFLKTLNNIYQGKSCSCDILCQRKDGSSIWVDMNTTPVLDFKGDKIGFINVSKDITDRIKAENELKESLNEKEMLFGEINKRMENYFTTVSSLLELQSPAMTNKKDIENLKDNKNRIKAMLLIHKVLSKSDDFAIVNFSKFIKRLIWQLKISYNLNPNVNLNIKIDSVMLDVDIAVPCGLIANELLTNAFKHNFNGGDGEINFDFYLNYNGIYVMRAMDNGSAKVPENNQMSLMLVKTFVNQLGGEVDLSQNGIFDFKITFPRPEY